MTSMNIIFYFQSNYIEIRTNLEISKDHVSGDISKREKTTI